MSLDIRLTVVKPTEVFSANITHNLGNMAEAAGIYMALWRPEEIGITKANELIPILRKGLAFLEDNPGKMRQYDAKNGWGTYPDFLRFVREVLAACVENPEAAVNSCR